PSESRSKSCTWTMLGCCSSETTRASSTNMAVNCSLAASVGNTRLMATLRVKPAAPCVSPRHTLAIPPVPAGATSSYLPVIRLAESLTNFVSSLPDCTNGACYGTCSPQVPLMQMSGGQHCGLSLHMPHAPLMHAWLLQSLQLLHIGAPASGGGIGQPDPCCVTWRSGGVHAGGAA